MAPSGEQPPEQRTPPQPAGDSVRLEACASGEARINQAGRDLHLHYQDGVRGARRGRVGHARGGGGRLGMAGGGHSADATR
jgi:hypothetical protein